MPAFNELVENARDATGPEYRNIRDEIRMMKMSEDLIDSCKQGADWDVRVLCDIFRGWRSSAMKYDYIRGILDGSEPELESGKYLSGYAPIDKSVALLKPLGKKYSPALFEILLKEPDKLNDNAFSVSTGALLLWDDRSAIPVYRALFLDRNSDSAFREMVIRPLLEFRADGLYEDFLAVYEDEDNSADLRAAALASLGSLDDERVYTLLVGIFNDREMQDLYRSAAAEGLTETGDLKAIDVLAAGYDTNESDELREAIITSLPDFDHPKAFDALRSISTLERDPGLVELIDEALEEAGE